jgi:hypothetical protein
VATYPKWGFVSGAMEKSKLHGVCNCDDPYFNTIGASLAIQGDVFGTMHPNREGHKQFCLPFELAAITDAVKDLRKQYAIQHAKEIAKEKILARARLAQRMKLAPASKMPRLQSSVTDLPADVLVQVRMAAKPMTGVAGGDDNHMPDDSER